ncbi:hypothetical protein ACUOA8_57540, partial [Escherichia sp. SS-MK2]
VLHTLGVQQILTACEGREALYLLQLCHVDLVLCDIDMPGIAHRRLDPLDSARAAERLRRSIDADRHDHTLRHQRVLHAHAMRE